MCGLWKSLLYWSYFIPLEALPFFKLYSVQSSLKIASLVSSNDPVQMPPRKEVEGGDEREIEQHHRQGASQCGATGRQISDVSTFYTAALKWFLSHFSGNRL